MLGALFYKIKGSVVVQCVKTCHALEGRRQVPEVVLVLPNEIHVCLFFPPNYAIPDDYLIFDLIEIMSGAQHHTTTKNKHTPTVLLYSAWRYKKICLVFQLKSGVKSIGV